MSQADFLMVPADWFENDNPVKGILNIYLLASDMIKWLNTEAKAV